MTTKRYYIINRRLILFLILLGSISISCQQEAEFDIPEPKQDLVVDGWIEKGEYAKIFLTKSSGYFENLDSAQMVALMVRYAKVSLSDGVNTEILTLRRDDNLFPPFYYQSTEIKGEVGKNYQMTVELSGKMYSAKTTIPTPVEIDSLFFVPSRDFPDKGFLYMKFRDPVGENYYRLYTKKLGKDEDYRPTNFSTFNDGSNDGKEMTIELSRSSYFEKGDSVMVRFASIDKDSYDFWRYADSKIYSSLNPFAISSNETVTNIVGGIGIWSGFAASYRLIVIE